MYMKQSVTFQMLKYTSLQVLCEYIHVYFRDKIKTWKFYTFKRKVFSFFKLKSFGLYLHYLLYKVGVKFMWNWHEAQFIHEFPVYMYLVTKLVLWFRQVMLNLYENCGRNLPFVSLFLEFICLCQHVLVWCFSNLITCTSDFFLCCTNKTGVLYPLYTCTRIGLYNLWSWPHMYAILETIKTCE